MCFFMIMNASKMVKGRKVVASDFVYSFKRIIDVKIASPGHGYLIM